MIGAQFKFSALHRYCLDFFELFYKLKKRLLCISKGRTKNTFQINACLNLYILPRKMTHKIEIFQKEILQIKTPLFYYF